MKKRNWFQEEMWLKGITFACLNKKGLLCDEDGRLCMSCLEFTPGENSDEDWTCAFCEFEHKQSSQVLL
jgi:hypothetical protein